MAEMNIPYVFAMRMEDGIVIGIVAVGPMTVEKKDGIGFVVVRLLTLKI